MERQLVLIEQEPDWRLDDHTREVGRAGVAQARAALRAAARQPERPAGGAAGRSAA
jgi:hypothetical protein